MVSLRKIPYTKPLPAGAEVITRKGKRVARWIDGKHRPRAAEVTEDGTRIRQLSRKWYGSYVDVDGVERCVPLATDKTAAGQMLAELVRKAELGKAGIVDPFAEHRQRPLSEHVADWQSALTASGATGKHVRQTVACAGRVLERCGAVFLADLSGSRIQSALAALKEERPSLPPLDPNKQEFTKSELATALGVKPHCLPGLVKRWGLAASGNGKARRYPRATIEALRSLRLRGKSAKTGNLYLDAVKAFCRWLEKDRRWPHNPGRDRRRSCR
ncbi:MAG: hypothetical protein ACYC3I_24725 [Gemmataceae bacterium]